MSELVTSDEISRRLTLWINSGTYDIVIPNYFFGRYEADLFRVNQSDYFIEYEIKVSKADFKKDFEKGFTNWKKETYNKHEAIRDGKRCNRFYFVVPNGLIDKSEVPRHAGLIFYHRDIPPYFSIAKNAPLLHKQPVKDFRDIARKLTDRNHNLRARLNRKIS